MIIDKKAAAVDKLCHILANSIFPVGPAQVGGLPVEEFRDLMRKHWNCEKRLVEQFNILFDIKD